MGDQRDKQRAEPRKVLDIEELRREIQIGIDELDRGEGEVHNMEDILAEIERRPKGNS